MAGTLTVQTIQGPSSGANANKVLIPAGQTLVGSSGQVVKTTLIETSTQATVQSQSYTSVWSGSYTPVLTSSTLVFDSRLLIQSSNYTNAEGRYSLLLNLNGSLADDYGSLGNYDYDASGGIWNKTTISTSVDYSNTTGSAVSFDFQIKCVDGSANAQAIFSEGSNRSSLIVTEIAP